MAPTRHCDDCNEDIPFDKWYEHLTDEHAEFVQVPRPDGSVAFGQVVWPKPKRKVISK